jgi:hypothetical protein
MTFQFGPVPDPDKDGIMECHHYRRAVDDYDRDGALMDSPMLHGWFVYNVVELALGEDAILKYSPREIFEKLEEMSTSHQEYVDLMDIKDAQEADELFNPNPLTA